MPTIIINPPTASADTKQLLVSSNDTTESYLETKLVNGTGSTIVTNNDGSNETIQVNIDHDATTNYSANEHIDHSSVLITTLADTGLSGGGDITTTRNLSLDITSLTLDSSPANDDLVVTYDTSASSLKKIELSNLLGGGGSGGTDITTTNVETLSGNKSLSSSSEFTQILDPDGATREVYLGTMTVGKIINNTIGTYSLDIKTAIGEATLISLSYESLNKGVLFTQLQDLSYYFEVISSYSTLPDGSVNVEVMSGNKTLVSDDAFLQLLDPDGADREVILNGRTTGKIVNNTDGTNAISIKETSGGSVVLTLSAASFDKGVLYNQLPNGSYYFEVFSQYIEANTDSINIETITDTKSLVATDAYNQFLDPSGGDQIVVLGEKNKGRILNNSDGTNSLDVKETTGGSTVISLSASSGYKTIYYLRLPDDSYYIEVRGTFT